MIFYAVLKENGCIEHAGISRNPPEGHVVLPQGCTPEHELYLMYVSGEWQERPSLQLWERTETGVRIPACPSDVTLDVYDADSGAFLGSAADGVADLPDAGRYRIDVSAPEPWAPYDSFFVEVV